MSTSARTSALRVALAAMLAVAAISGVGGAASAASAAVPGAVVAHFVFTDVVPSTPMTRSQQFTLPMNAIVTEAQAFASDTPESGVTWSAEVCAASGSGCTPLTESLQGAVLIAGSHQLRVTVVMADGTATSSTAYARIAFTEQPRDVLASTGVGMIWPLIASAASVSALGILLATLARRRRTGNGDDAEVKP